MLLLLQPLLFLLAFGGGLSALVPDTALGGQYRAFLYPGILLMAIQAPAVSVGIRLITERYSDNIRELLVTPARRSSLLCGVCLGGCATATAQGRPPARPGNGRRTACRAPAARRPRRGTDPDGLHADRAHPRTGRTHPVARDLPHAPVPDRRPPLLFGSGALVPLSTLLSWVTSAAALNPLAYAADILRHTARPTASAGAHGNRRRSWRRASSC